MGEDWYLMDGRKVPNDEPPSASDMVKGNFMVGCCGDFDSDPRIFMDAELI